MHVRANCYVGDGTVHSKDQFLMLEEIRSIFRISVLSSDEVKKIFPLPLEGMAGVVYVSE